MFLTKTDIFYFTSIKILKAAIEQQDLNKIKEIICENSHIPVEKLSTSRNDRFSKLELHLLINEYNHVSKFITNFIHTASSAHKCDEMPKERLASFGNQDAQEINWNRIFFNNNHNALHYACKLGHLKAVQVLIECAKFDLNAQTNSLERNTGLNIVCDLGYIEIAKVLVANGADINYEN
jgi:hypothetical protein